MKQVWRFPVKGFFNGPKYVSIPKGAEVLSCGYQPDRGEASIWALVDPNAELEERQFFYLPTGHPIKAEHLKFIGTFMMDGFHVFHAFEVLQ